MSISRRRALTLAAGLPLALQACRGADPLVERALGEEVYRKGSAWLWKQQQRDGSFRSDAGGLPKSGHTITAFVLLHSQVLPTDQFPYPRASAIRASDWLLRQVADNGALGFAPQGQDHPVYATAMTIHAMWRLRPRLFGDNTYPMLWWLRDQQLTADSGWEGHPAQGGFSMGSFDPPSPSGPPPHVDLSLTRAAVQAMASIGIHANDPAMIEARSFVARCRKADGSYAFSPAARGEVGPGAGSGSATADALQILVANRLPDEQIEPHVPVLRERHRLDEPSRVGSGANGLFRASSRFYYRCGSAAVFEWMGGPPGWADDLIRTLAAEQTADGYWEDAAGPQHGEPLLATGFALSALGSALRSAERPEWGPRI